MTAFSGQWALILGASSGMGRASAAKLAAEGYGLLLVHRDRKSVARELELFWESLRAHGVPVHVWNTNALDAEVQQQLVAEMQEVAGSHRLHLLLHSIASGNVKPILSADGGDVLSEDDFHQTIHAMGTSLLQWGRLLLKHDLWTENGRIIGLSSEGSHMAGANYAAVGAAKAVLETLCIYMARELAPAGLRTNIINAGITDTPALRGIPGSEAILEQTRQRNPYGRLTTTADVANVVYLLSRPEADWINGATIRVDGGEQIIGW